MLGHPMFSLKAMLKSHSPAINLNAVLFSMFIELLRTGCRTDMSNDFSG